MKICTFGYLTLLLILFVSCYFEPFSKMPVESASPPVEPVLVIESITSPYHQPVILPAVIKVKLSRLHRISETNLSDSINNALVVIKSHLTTDTLIYSRQANCYSIRKTIKAGDWFELAVSQTGFHTVSARDTVPSLIVPVSTIVEPYIGMGSNGNPSGIATITFNDPPDEVNFYEVTIGSGSSAYRLTSRDMAVLGESYYPQIPELNNSSTERLLFSDASFNGQQKTLLVQFTPTHGFVVEGQSSFIEIYGSQLTVSFRNVSYSYYRYFTSLLEYNFNRLGDELMGKSEPKNLFSNIENGIGIFGFYQEYTHIQYIEKMTFPR